MRELILYIAKKSEDDPYFGAVKLNKILLFSDLSLYGKSGQPITGDVYQKLKHGPAPRKLVPVRDKMIKAGDCAEQTRVFFGRKQKRLVALREPDLSLFSGEEIAEVDAFINLLRGSSASAVSDLSHSLVGYDCVEIGEEIPYETVFLDDRELTPNERRHAKGVEVSLGRS